MSFNFRSTTAAAAIVAASVFASDARAMPVSDLFIDSVTGVWTAVSGATVSGLGSNEIRWGTPTTTGGEQSGYRFDGAAPPTQGPYSEGQVFDLGSFTHFNFPIFAPSITFAELEVTTAGTVGGAAFSITSVFDFDHFETPNDGSPCAAGGVQPCPDLVTPTLNIGASESVSVGGVDYFISVTGFDIGTGFLTLEGQSNTAQLQGTFTARVSAIPLPAAGWMLIAGLGGLAAMGRRRKKAG
ncbi:THxN family PEP-CTERM protein [Roseovarius aestuariivivens]|uniref:THxN family PEP-CTERM protein n=1 Tax=Roseovarius aestuariivivens TaxID=1888910 RepID=UPI001AEC6212|nr:THxN family PEP-CTERM protein [Roseovarius aestuariivivens]